MLKRLRELGKDLVIIYAEDEEDVRVGVVNILEKFFKKVLIAEDGQEAIDLFKNNLVDLVITDIAMPHKNGLEFAKVVKGVDSNIPIIISTAFNDTDYFIEAISLNVSKYILKPINSKNLISVLLEVVEDLKNREDLTKYREEVVQDSHLDKCIDVISSVSNMSENPFLIVKNNKIIFFNNAFIKEFGFYKELIDGNIEILENYDIKLKPVKESLFIGEDIDVYSFIKE